MKKVIITSFAVILAVALCIPIYAALSSKIEASMTDHETGYEEETGEPFGRAPAYVMIRCGKNQIYPESYFKGSVTYQEEGDPVTEAGTGADGVDYAVSVAYNRGDTLSVYYENYGSVKYVSYRQQGREDHNYSDENFINSFLETAENGVYRFIVTVALTDGNKIEEWEYPFDVEVCKEELVGSETDGVIYADYGSYCVVSGHAESVPENVIILSSVDFDGRELPVRAIGENAFSECADIKSVTLPEGLIEIGKSAFWRCSGLQSINLPQGLKRIKNFAFGTCGSLASVTLPDSLETLDVGAFALCGSLTSIVIPDKVTSLNEIVFADCADLKSVTIGSGVRSIHYRAFEKSDGIESIIISDNNPKYHASGNCIIETNSKRLIFGTDDCVIPDDGSVTTIASRAFDYRMNLECISIPASVAKLEDRAFNGCPRLTTVYYGGTVSQWESATKTLYLENQYVLKYQCTVICSDGTVEPVVDSCIEYGTEPWDDEVEVLPEELEKGDCNGDEAVDNKDVVALFRYVSGSNKVSDEYVYDYNNDGFVNNKDVVDLFRVLSGGKDTETSAVTEEQENNEYKIYLYANGEGGEGDGKTEGYTGKNFLGMADESKKQNMGGKTIEIFGGEQTMLYMKTISFGICDEKYDMYIGDNGLFTFGETTGKLVTYDYLSGGRADGFTPPVNSNSSQQGFIDYAKNVLLEYTGTSVDDCDVSIKQYGSKYDIIFRKRFSGIYRIDDLMVTINNSGDVLKIKARVCDNLFERFKDVKIDAEKLKKQIYDLSYNPSYVSYEILLRAIPDGNELWVIADVNYEYENNGETLCSGTEYITKVAEIPSGQKEPETFDTEFETWDAYAGTEAE